MNIVVLSGGTSTEREVSLSSGKEIYNAIKDYEDINAILLDVGVPTLLCLYFGS